MFGLGNPDTEHSWVERPVLPHDRRAPLQLLGIARENGVGPIRRRKRSGTRQPLRKFMVHCGYEPTATLGLQAQRGDTWKTVKFNFGPKPKPTGRGSETLVFNGVSSGNGHITGKRPEVAAQAS